MVTQLTKKMYIISILIKSLIYVSTNEIQEQSPIESLDIDITSDIVIEEEEDVIEYSYTLTPEEKEMLASLLWLEGRGEDIECQIMKASLIFNRYDSKQWGTSFEEIVYANNQFEPAHLIGTTTPSDVQYEIIEQIAREGSVLPNYILYFRAGYYHNWGDQVPYTSCGNTYFSYSVKDMEIHYGQ